MSVVNVQTRPAVPEDASELVRMAELMYESMGLPVDDAWRATAVEQTRARLGRDVMGFVVERSDDGTAPGRIVASGIGVTPVRMPGPTNLSGRFGYIQWVATEPDMRHRGYARAVLSALLAWFDAAGVTTVELHATPLGEPLYRSLGFENDDNPGLRRRAEPLPVGGSEQRA
jgi:GNAT superfamily N-acetyltransferase